MAHLLIWNLLRLRFSLKEVFQVIHSQLVVVDITKRIRSFSVSAVESIGFEQERFRKVVQISTGGAIGEKLGLCHLELGKVDSDL
jgi:hypothetical protein